MARVRRRAGAPSITRPLLLAAAVLLTAVQPPARAGGATLSRLDYCATLLVDPARWRPSNPPQWRLALQDPVSQGRLLYLGVLHARPPGDPQYAEIAQAFADFRPQIAFFEGPWIASPSLAPARAERFGEPAYVQALAQASGVPSRSLEADEGGVLEDLVAKFGPESTEIFYILRSVAQQTTMLHVKSHAVLAIQTSAFLRRESRLFLAQGIAPPARDLSDFISLLARYMPGQRWYAADLAWFSPLRLSNDTSPQAREFHTINREETQARNRVMFYLLGRQILAGRRVLAIVGRNHIPLQAPALACLVERRGR